MAAIKLKSIIFYEWLHVWNHNPNTCFSKMMIIFLFYKSIYSQSWALVMELQIERNWLKLILKYLSCSCSNQQTINKLAKLAGSRVYWKSRGEHTCMLMARWAVFSYLYLLITIIYFLTESFGSYHLFVILQQQLVRHPLKNLS